MNLLTLDLPAPHAISITVSGDEIDAYDHVNNSVYVTRFDRSRVFMQTPAFGMRFSATRMSH